MDKIVIKGAREHNLKNIDLELPRDKLVVVSGVSGSGKSSLVFDTLFAEGQRRYVESLSSYARQFLGRMDKPDVDYIEGLSPAISIEQKTTSKNPRSTVGTITEIYDYLRLLYARIGHATCPNDGSEISEQSLDQIVEKIMLLEEGTKLILLAPVVKGRKGEHQKIIDDARAMGFGRIRLNGTIYSLDEDFNLDKQKKHDIEIVVDRIKLDYSNRYRLSESVESALEVGNGEIFIAFADDNKREELFFSEHGSCRECGFSMPPLEPRLFSFNNPYGSCPDCSGLGHTLEFDENLVIDKNLSITDGGIIPFNITTSAWYKATFKSIAKHYNFSLDTPLKDLPAKTLDALINGSKGEKLEFNYTSKDGSSDFNRLTSYDGVMNELRRRHRESMSEAQREYYETFMKESLCQGCRGERLRKEALAVKIAGKNINQTCSMAIGEVEQFFANLKISDSEAKIASQIFKEVNSRLGFMVSVGLDYLSLDRKSGTLSGGEAQRIRLATQIGSSLMGVLYILDEPTIGLHQRDNDRLISMLKYLRDLGNTLIVVEHDEQLIREADYLVDIGPKAGVHGGKVVAYGTPDEVSKVEESPTGRYLSGKEIIEVPKKRRTSKQYIEIKGAEQNNLKSINVKFLVGALNIITGVSGSGKSTLLNEIVSPLVHNQVNHSTKTVGKYKSAKGLDVFDSMVCIDQDPIGRTPRSNPATYVGVWTPIRDLFASLNESKVRGYKAGRFSFNVKGGRCETCEGSGFKKIEMHFLPDVFVVCDVCAGKRFNKETLEVRYKGKNIHEVLKMTIEEGQTFFESIPAVHRKLSVLTEVGLGYIELGQSALTLSGGEAQRVKLANELSKRSTGKTCYIIDEPTTGLHFLDVKKLMESLQELVNKGNTAILIEHNLDVIKCGDYLVDLGPEGGAKGGELLGCGTPEQLVQVENSYTAKYLKEYLK